MEPDASNHFKSHEKIIISITDGYSGHFMFRCQDSSVRQARHDRRGRVVLCPEHHS